MMTAEGKIFSVAVSQAAKTKEEPNFVYKVILLYKVVMFFFLQLQISKPIDCFVLVKLYIGPKMVLGYFIFRYKSQNSGQVIMCLNVELGSPSGYTKVSQPTP